MDAFKTQVTACDFPGSTLWNGSHMTQNSPLSDLQKSDFTIYSFFFFSPFTLYSILCSSHSGSLLFLEYAKHTPTSGPLQLIFSLPGICIPLSNYYSNVTSFYLFLSLWCPQDPQESFGCTADPHYPWKSKHRYWVDTEDQPFFSVDSKDVSWEDSRDWVQVPHN